MSVYNRRFLDGAKNPFPQHLQQVGPRIPVQISIPATLAAQFAAAEKPIPKPIQGYALIDTGASVLCVDEGVLNELGLSPFSTASVSTPNGDVVQGIYPVSLSFSGTAVAPIPLARCLGANLKSQRKPPLETIALIGRDTLINCVFIYNGKDASYTFAY